MGRYFHDILIAVESILANQTRSMLTALGIIFGVAAVIAMLAIGRGAQQEILEQIKMVGVNNIMITPIVEPSSEDEESGNGNGEKEQRKFSPGLTLKDVEAIREVVPTVNTVSPEITVNSHASRGGKRASAKLMGVSNDYFQVFNLGLQTGQYFNQYQENNGIPVCVIGDNIKNQFFSSENAIGQYIKFANVWLRVVGVLERTDVSLTRFEDIGVNVMNDNIYIPVNTMLLRFQNRALVAGRIRATAAGVTRGRHRIAISVTPSQNVSSNYHQLDRVVVQVTESKELDPSTDLLSRLLLRRHQDVKDFEITVPELLLKQEQRTKDIFNIVLGAIASISL
ncbi:MAG: ABC transporter permease, partial [Bacteroidota bacterium]